MHYLYIIHSQSIDKYYIGESINPENRLQQHITHYFKYNYTKAANDWTLVLTYPCQSKENALYLEKFIKRMKSKKLIEKIIVNTSILDDILSKK
ncbi:GIY-YIG nuclease family protein [Tenacibaculum sp. IB213877]|uniref:GIY-YIG nuclease family protein n=1 Tax=Tenacibaculum sp. IB213877 TaxID=3097351 RepID=UPI002A5ACD8F|nr:GIY-YIG nuclease family protein [Tenacibaculum sp. IB213877]MDY0780219.1 GIY-YIG nuclease family protein [Tenacibaculum sp. IB213877]